MYKFIMAKSELQDKGEFFRAGRAIFGQGGPNYFYHSILALLLTFYSEYWAYMPQLSPLPRINSLSV